MITFGSFDEALEKLEYLDKTREIPPNAYCDIKAALKRGKREAELNQLLVKGVENLNPKQYERFLDLKSSLGYFEVKVSHSLENKL